MLILQTTDSFDYTSKPCHMSLHQSDRIILLSPRATANETLVYSARAIILLSERVSLFIVNNVCWCTVVSSKPEVGPQPKSKIKYTHPFGQRNPAFSLFRDYHNLFDGFSVDDESWNALMIL